MQFLSFRYLPQPNNWFANLTLYITQVQKKKNLLMLLLPSAQIVKSAFAIIKAA